MVKRGGAWKQERSSVSLPGRPRARSNKYRPRPTDPTSAPPAGTRQKFWVGGYTKKDGTKVLGHFRDNPNYRGR